MRRRDFIRVVAGSTVAWPLAARAQQGERMRLIGVLMGWPESDPRARSWLAALLFNPAIAPQLKFYMPSIKATASSVAVEVSAAPVHAKDEIEGVIAALARDPGGGLIVMPDVFNVINRDLVIALAARYGVPAIYFTAAYFAKSGGLICYGTDFTEQFRQAAGYVDRILKGEKPANLPIQQPTKFELVINLKAAKALGLTIPHNLLVLADEVIE